jgi:hypothetical protein
LHNSPQLSQGFCPPKLDQVRSDCCKSLFPLSDTSVNNPGSIHLKQKCRFLALTEQKCDLVFGHGNLVFPSIQSYFTCSCFIDSLSCNLPTMIQYSGFYWFRQGLLN